ncbi:MAG TPA: ATP-binding protein [Dehalococcoidia bacterium]|nr:ATP-binding protein [Dehalococcoidia bacterium]
MTIRVRIALFGLAVVGGTVIFVTLAFWGLFQATGSEQQDRQLAARAESALAAIASASPEALRPQPLLAPVNPATSEDIFLVVTGPGGEALAATGAVQGRPPALPADLLAAASASGQARATVPSAAGRLRLHVRPWSRPDLGLSGYVVAAQTTRRVEQDIGVVTVFLVAAAVFAFLVAGGAIWLVIGRALRPLKQLALLTDEVGRTHDLSRRLPVPPARDDLRRLSESFNGMMSRLEDAYGRLAVALEAQQRFVADASHELRTPLTTIRSNAGFLLQRPDADEADRVAALRDIAEESERMSRLVNDLLALARADAGYHLEVTLLDLGEVVREVCRQAAGLHPDREVRAHAESVLLQGNGDALRRLLWILIDNGVRHTREGGRVRVSLRRRGNEATLLVEDDGDGIPEEHLGRIFDRFYQADPSRSGGGAGLGLAIARWIVEEHSGRISAANNSPWGAVFRVDLPLAAPAAEGGSAEAVGDEARDPASAVRNVAGATPTV